MATAYVAKINRRLLMPGQRDLICRISQQPKIAMARTTTIPYPVALMSSGSAT